LLLREAFATVRCTREEIVRLMYYMKEILFNN